MVVGASVVWIGTVTCWLGSGVHLGTFVGLVGAQVCSHGIVVGHGGLRVVVVLMVVVLVAVVVVGVVVVVVVGNVKVVLGK